MKYKFFERYLDFFEELKNSPRMSCSGIMVRKTLRIENIELLFTSTIHSKTFYSDQYQYHNFSRINLNMD